VSFVPGWDCHGLPIEILALNAVRDQEKKERRKLKQKLKSRPQPPSGTAPLPPTTTSPSDGGEAVATDAAAVSAPVTAEMAAVAVRRVAKSFALKAIANQKEAFQRWGVLGAWEDPYLTMHPRCVTRLDCLAVGDNVNLTTATLGNGHLTMAT
jgi:isoleucyl-tRNA synthetase